MTDILKAFKKYPHVFFLSKTNINMAMEFFVTKMKIKIYNIIQRPKLLDAWRRGLFLIFKCPKLCYSCIF